ncbi:hypothetical protein [Alteribacillus sp. YIM 98480]|uniref:hypothetical protein n=1 Tax=Alteribacillus sp. YIM 98480 TaxID=2606599 RepID=UPI00131C06D3|nr:hypothetical protein [Alteribacillus sp. YIM 98480]
MAPELPDFKEYRKSKQQRADRDLKDLLHSYDEWLAYHTNLREKVRAKHLFSKKTGCPLEQIESRPWKKYFEDWFVFDYITVIGTRLFDMYIKERADQLSSAKVQLSGLMLTASLEPYHLVKKEQSELTAKSWLKDEKKKLTILQDSSISLDISAPYFLTRSIRCGFENRLISPVIPLRVPRDNSVIMHWRDTIQAKEEEHQRLRFMKENGVSLMTYADYEKY